MADESVVVELLMTAGQFISEAQKAAKAAEGIGKSSKQTSQEAVSGMDRMKQSARENSAEWQTVGSTLTKIGLSQAAFGTAVAVTGGNYNRLQQTSRAALSSMLGGTKAANEQMDKLDAWATSSPFSRAVWIEAQQQLLAFGVEANKVIPYMEGVQNAVAAAGGSEADLRGIVAIMAKISSSSKITGADLNQFGNWGVNAAELIGLAMGKTGAQIRDEITAGTLDADVALDALAKGMNTKFAGAAANVKNTFDGAFDRVKAAFRDLSSEIMEPFIGKQGGGLFTSLLNEAADLMRAFQKLPTPVKDFTAAFGLATTALTLGGGALMQAVPKVLELHRSLVLLGQQGVPVVSKLAAGWAAVPGQLGGAFTELKGGFSSIGESMSLASQMGVSKAQALKVGIGSAFSGVGSAAKGVGSALLGAFGGPWGLLATAAITGITMAIMDNQRKAQAAAQAAKEYADSLDQITGNATAASRELLAMQALDGAGLDAWKKQGVDLNEYLNLLATDLPASLAKVEEAEKAAYGKFIWSDAAKVAADMRRMYDQAADGAQLFADKNEVLADAADGTAASMDSAGDAVDEYGNALEGAGKTIADYVSALKALDEQQRTSSNSALTAREAQRKYIDTLQSAYAALEENGKGLDINTEAGRKNQAALDDLARASQTSVDAMLSQRDANGNLVHSLADVQAEAQRGRTDFIELAVAMGMGKEEAENLATEFGLIPADVETKFLVESQEALAKQAELKAQFADIPEEILTKLLAFGDQAIEVAAVVEEAIKVGVPAEKVTKLLADGSDATATAADVKREINSVKQEKAADILGNNMVFLAARFAQQELDNTQQGAPASIKAKDDTKPAADAATRTMNSAKQSSPASIRAINDVWPATSAARREMDSVQSKTVTITANYVARGKSNMTAIGYASGGAIRGAGGTTSDLIPAWLSNGEHVLTAREVMNLGGQGNVYALRSLLRNRPDDLRSVLGFADGGAPGSRPVYVPQPHTFQAQQSAGTTVIVNDNSTVNNPVAVPETTKRRTDLELAASLARGLG